MALQDQQQVSVLKRTYSPLALLALMCGAGLGGFFVYRNWTSPHPSVSANGTSDLHSTVEIGPAKTNPLAAIWRRSATTTNNRGPSDKHQEISPGLPPQYDRDTPYDPQLIRRRIEAVESGNLYGDTSVAYRQGNAKNDQRTDAPTISIADNLIDIHVSHLTAALTLDPVQFQQQVATLSFPADEMYRIEAPIDGAGVLIDSNFVPPGGSALVGSGSRIYLQNLTNIHLRPAEPLRPPLGSG